VYEQMFTFPQKVLFRHCDPAGIVFFPRYFEMINDCMEAFFSDVLNTPFEKVLKSGGIPTAQISTQFTAPSYHGDQLLLSLSVTRVGRTALDYKMVGTCGDETRFHADGTLVHVNDTGHPTAWADAMRDTLLAQKDPEQ